MEIDGVICDACGRKLRNKDGLTSHKKLMHGRPKVLENHTVCQECSLPLFKIDRLRDHLISIHGMEMEFENRAFLSLEDFYVWKLNYERQNNCSYVIKKKNNSPNDFLYLFDCSRSGVYKNRRFENKRSLKTQGSKKIGFTCTSTIKLTMMDGIYCVRFCMTHYGHDIEVKHVGISVVDRQEIVDMLLQGLSIDEIFDKYKNPTDGEVRRIHLLNKKDIRNIATVNNIPLKTRVKQKKILEIPEDDVRENSNVILKTEDEVTHTYILLPNNTDAQ